MPADAHQVVGTLGAAVLPPRGPPPIPAVQAGNVSVKASIARRPSTSPGLRRRCSCTPAPDGELDALVRKLIEKAKAGDIAALRLCLDRLLPPRRDRLVTFALPKVESAKDACAAAAVVMTTRRRLARLERLERLQPTPSCPWFIIAPERAQAIIAAYDCLGGLLGRHLWCGMPGFEEIAGLPDRQRRRRPPRAWPNCCGRSVAPRTILLRRPGFDLERRSRPIASACERIPRQLRRCRVAPNDASDRQTSDTRRAGRTC